MCEEWKIRLEQLKAGNDDYVHFAKLVEGKGHWMDRVDAEALDWVRQYNRNTFPKKITWHFNQDRRFSFYNIFLIHNHLQSNINHNYDKKIIDFQDNLNKLCEN